MRTERWKYIRRYGDWSRPLLANCDDSPSKDHWLAHGWAERPVVTEQLYDLVFDPVETSNRAADPNFAAVLSDLRGRMNHWMAETDDPLLRWAVPCPPGAVVNAAEDRSPNQGQPRPAQGPTWPA